MLYLGAQKKTSVDLNGNTCDESMDTNEVNLPGQLCLTNSGHLIAPNTQPNLGSELAGKA